MYIQFTARDCLAIIKNANNTHQKRGESRIVLLIKRTLIGYGEDFTLKQEQSNVLCRLAD
jgi:hypothetical protein